MNHFEESPPAWPEPIPPAAKRKDGFWQRLAKRRFLLISILIHVVFAVLAALFVVQRFSTHTITFTSAPPSNDASKHALDHPVQMAKKQTTSAPLLAQRIVSTGLSKITLPEMPTMPATDDFTPSKMAGMGGNAMGLGLGSSGGGGGGGGGGVPFFGLRDHSDNALVGTFYDLKQSASRRDTRMTPKKYAQEVTNFIQNGWNSTFFNRYFKGSKPLYATQIFTPIIPADEGPKEFDLQKLVKPRMWVVVYKGKVTAPDTGIYHFVGAGDDVLMVKFDGRLVLARNYDNPDFGVVQTHWRPMANYDYGWSNIPNGFAKGDAINVVAGHVYSIQIIIGEQPGGSTSDDLLIQKEGVDYQKDAKGNPILPVFRTADTKLADLRRHQTYPPHMDGGPIWKGVAGPAASGMDDFDFGN
jgi:hypothetical protein